MKTAVIAVTQKGCEQAVKIGTKLDAHIYVKEEFIGLFEANEYTILPINGSFLNHIGYIFKNYEALVFIMACGIVVRAIAPYIQAKAIDPAVVVTDEKGTHVISLLSGHLGGANRMAQKVAAITKGTAVITTSTDVNNVISFDMFALDNNCVIENLGALKYISARLLNGGSVVLCSDYSIKGDMPQNIDISKSMEKVNQKENEYMVVLSNRCDIRVQSSKMLIIRPRNLVLGIGCKKDTSKEQITHAVVDFMKNNNKSILSLKCVATIDLKMNEKGLLEFCEEYGLKLKVIGRDEVIKVEKDFSSSDFVKQKVGVSSVAEPCAVLASSGGKLICGKTVYKGITLALSEESREFKI